MGVWLWLHGTVGEYREVWVLGNAIMQSFFLGINYEWLG